MMVFWTGLVLGLVGGGTAFLVRYSATSEKVCAQCHPDLIESWKNSAGHPSVSTTCYECHSKGIKLQPDSWNILAHARDQFVPPVYLADDELTSQRCMDCHLNVLDPGYTVKKKVIKFNHRIHYQDELECIECHRTAGHEYLSESTNRPSIPECIDCHYREMDGPPKNRKCLNCHEVMLAPGRTWTLTSPRNFSNKARHNGIQERELIQND